MQTIDYANLRHVNIAWAAIAEPADKTAGAARQLLGAARALEAAVRGHPLPLRARERVPAEGFFEQLAVAWQKSLETWQARLNQLDLSQILGDSDSLGVSIITQGEEDWPERLDDLEFTAPSAIWVAGDRRILHQKANLAFVGSRDCSETARLVTSKIAKQAAERGIVVTSGGALGVDAAAHAGALQGAPVRRGVAARLASVEATDSLPAGEACGGTIAVLCGGLARLYPASNEPLFLEIQHRGALISESPPHWRPAKWRFKKRNRLIAALAQATIVSEAARRSGALSTAHAALELGRNVGAIPGNVTSEKTVGSNGLLRQGASVVTGIQDALDLLGNFLPEIESTRGMSGGGTGHSGGFPGHLNPIEERVYAALPLAGCAQVEELVVEAGLSGKEISTALYSLQLQGLAGHEAGGWKRH